MEPIRFRQVIPVLPVREVTAACAFYARLGFGVRFQDSPDHPRYAGVARDGAWLHLQWQEPSTFREGVDTLMLRFLVSDPDALHAEYVTTGIDAQPPRDTAWGTREFAFYDLDGNGLTFFREG